MPDVTPEAGGGGRLTLPDGAAAFRAHERPQVARKVVEVIDEATKLANADFDKYKPIIAKYTPMRAEQLDLLAKPYLRGFGDLNDTDLNSYQALVDVFQKEGVLQSPISVRDKILKTTDFGS